MHILHGGGDVRVTEYLGKPDDVAPVFRVFGCERVPEPVEP